MDNKKIYDSAEVVKKYARKNKLTPPELNILNIMAEKNVKTMLDIGIGTGRTTHYFSKMAAHYTGLDYSAEMVSYCQEYFSEHNTAVFMECDARDMSVFNDSTFDFVLFSFNGIDCVNYDDRMKIFDEIKRVLKTKGYFAFSTHNLYNVELLYSFQFPRNPLKYYKEYYRYKKVNQLNPKVTDLLKSNYVSIKDGDLDFTTEYVYVKPEYQLKVLDDLGFENIKTYHLIKGEEISENAKWDEINDPWIYYLCRKK